MRITIYTAAVLTSILSLAQNVFEEGYFINKQGERTECLIKNLDWLDNPANFQYKLRGSDEVVFADLQNATEFSIYNKFKYVKRTVQLDRSSFEDISKLTEERNPKFVTETLFLKILIEGKADLYTYREPGLIRFFYRKNQEIIPLVYRKFLTRKRSTSSFKETEGAIAINDAYKQELWNNLSCTNMTQNSFMALKYQEKSLVRIFKRYHHCIQEKYQSYVDETSTGQFNFRLMAGINQSSLDVNYSLGGQRDVFYDPEITVNVGAELEYIFPWRGRNWSMFFAPEYSYFKATGNSPRASGDKAKQTVPTDLQSLVLRLGMRRYFQVADNFKVFLDAAVVGDYHLKSSFAYKAGGSLDASNSSSANVACGFGVLFKDKLSAEAHYYFPREKLGVYSLYDSKFKTWSFVIGYRLISSG